MGGPDRAPLLLIGCVLGLALLVAAASAASTGVHVVKVASDGKTVIAERTVDYRWLEANLPVMGDGSTHYYHQGPTNDPADLWDPAESIGFEDDDMGALKGTRVRDICGLVGGMSPGDTLRVHATDGYPSKPFSYGTVYSAPARQGPMVLTWYRGGDGYVPAYWSGMKIVFFADTSVNPKGWHVFGLSDMKATMPESEWYYKYDSTSNVKYPSTTGLAIRYVDELRIFSTQSAPTKPTTTATTAKITTPTKGATTVATTVPATAQGATTGPTSSVVPTASISPSGSLFTTVTPPPDGSGVIVATTVPPTTIAGNATATGTALPTGNTTANVTEPPTVSPVSTETWTDLPTDNPASTGLDYVSDIDQGGTPTPNITANATMNATASPTATPAVTYPAIRPSVTVPPATIPTASSDQPGNRALTFTFSFEIRENGIGAAVNASPAGSAALVSRTSPLGTLWTFLKAVARMIDPFFS